MRIENWEVRQGDSTNLKHITITGVTNYTITGGMAYRGNITVLDKSTKSQWDSQLPLQYMLLMVLR